MRISFVKKGDSTSYNEKFHTNTITADYYVTHDMSGPLNIFTIHAEMDRFFKEMISDAMCSLPGTKDEDLVSLTLDSPALNCPIYIPYQPVRNLKKRSFLDSIDDVSSKRKDFFDDNNLQLILRIVKPL